MDLVDEAMELNEADRERLEYYEKEYTQLLLRVRKQLKAANKFLICIYGALFLMIGMCLWEWSKESYIWLLIYAILGIVNLHNLKWFHEDRRVFKRMEFKVLFILSLIQRMKDKESG